ncbi:unnamed protein product [Allacma fusca]|uniref:Uncharacterized protein n=1 Tax=Allacma fusca TaxID=39272 RepID=A0A8J2PC54_9HEXA|nr:unnamed protein product [Allacma fusca]
MDSLHVLSPTCPPDVARLVNAVWAMEKKKEKQISKIIPIAFPIHPPPIYGRRKRRKALSTTHHRNEKRTSKYWEKADATKIQKELSSSLISSYLPPPL